MKNKILVFTILVTLFIISCNKKTNIVDIEFTKEVSFDTIKVGDTISKYFEIKNKSSTQLKIKNLKTSCGCTLAKLKDSIIGKNSSTKIKVTFTAEEDNIGVVNKSIILDSNTKPNFTVMYLKGYVVK